MSTTPLIATGLRHAYGNRPALAGIDLRIEPGDFVVITGASGSGKSTLLHALAGVIVPDAGSVRFGDVSVSGASEEARSALRRTRFGVLFQFGQLVEELTAVENVALPWLLGGMPRRTAEARAGEWLGRVGVAESRVRSRGSCLVARRNAWRSPGRWSANRTRVLASSP